MRWQPDFQLLFGFALIAGACASAIPASAQLGESHRQIVHRYGPEVPLDESEAARGYVAYGLYHPHGIWVAVAYLRDRAAQVSLREPHGFNRAQVRALVQTFSRWKGWNWDGAMKSAHSRNISWRCLSDDSLLSLRTNASKHPVEMITLTSSAWHRYAHRMPAEKEAKEEDGER